MGPAVIARHPRPVGHDLDPTIGLASRSGKDERRQLIVLRLRRHVLFLVNSLPAAGGAEQFVLNQVRRTDRTSFDVSVCQTGGSRVLRRFFEDLDVSVYDLEKWVGADLRSLSRLVKILRQRSVDIL